ncbi:MAG: HEAT repeat domain-containing protein [Bacteroidales bacterium]|nr:HEAT repeat domain-containing protein [Bacteroidales bacterium]
MGIAISHVFFTLFVYQSNQALHHQFKSIHNAGYLAVPNSLISAELCRIIPAICGALFFSTTIGATLTFLSIAAAWIWIRWGKFLPYLIIPFICIWIMVPLKFFNDGIHPLLIVWMIIAPPILFTFTFKWGVPLHWPSTKYPWIILFPLLLILLCFGTLARSKSDLFIDMRDLFLFNSTAGKYISDFYYKYTLFPSEAFKSLYQKQLKTCHIEKIKNHRLKHQLENLLCANDYLPIADEASAIIIVSLMKNKLIFHNRDREVYQIGLQTFLSQPSAVLKKVSKNSDAYFFFRRLVAISLLTGMPVLLLLILYSCFYTLTSFFFRPSRSSVIAFLGCFIFVGWFTIMLGIYRHPLCQEKDLSSNLVSPSWQLRIKAIKTLIGRSLDIAEYHFLLLTPGNGSPSERYWTAKALGFSKKSETFALIHTFLEDPHLNVQCMALEALGRRGNKATWSTILNQLNSSSSWYVQWYAYKALRNLGWKQRPLH